MITAIITELNESINTRAKQSSQARTHETATSRSKKKLGFCKRLDHAKKTLRKLAVREWIVVHPRIVGV